MTIATFLFALLGAMDVGILFVDPGCRVVTKIPASIISGAPILPRRTSANRWTRFFLPNAPCRQAMQRPKKMDRYRSLYWTMAGY